MEVTVTAAGPHRGQKFRCGQEVTPKGMEEAASLQIAHKQLWGWCFSQVYHTGRKSSREQDVFFFFCTCWQIYWIFKIKKKIVIEDNRLINVVLVSAIHQHESQLYICPLLFEPPSHPLPLSTRMSLKWRLQFPEHSYGKWHFVPSIETSLQTFLSMKILCS